jgi:hypothetical protein
MIKELGGREVTGMEDALVIIPEDCVHPETQYRKDKRAGRAKGHDEPSKPKPQT